MNMARPPRGWLLGVLLTIFIFWFSGLAWEGFRNGKLSLVTSAGAFIMIVALSLNAHQALTNDDYKTAKPYRIGKRMFFVGLVISIVGDRLH
jgi:Na+/H+ antiporter NhaD/arsenite permease-like protein